MTDRAEPDAPLGAMIRVVRPARQTLPLVLASPHSGLRYPPAFLEMSRLSRPDLRLSEDSHIDTVFQDGPDLGVPLLSALFPRVYVDVNRARLELDPAMFSDPLPPEALTDTARVKSGLGTVPLVAGEGQYIYRDKLSFAEAERRLRLCYDPYHAALSGLIAETLARFGHCIVLDCHSMPSSSVAGMGGRHGAPDVVLGDRKGASCDSAVTRAAESVLKRAGFRVRRNEPYAGGFTTSHYGRPRLGVHVLQIEINRAIYMDERTRAPLPGMRRIIAVVPALIEALGRLPDARIAAE